MNMKTSELSALIISAALWMCVTGPLRAAETETDTSDSTVQTESTADVPVAPKVVKPRVKKIVEAPKSGKMASKTSNAKRADDTNAGLDDTTPSSMQTSVANANARLQAGDTPANSAMRTMSAPADNTQRTIRPTDPAAAQVDAPAANTNTMAADQLNEVDRTMSDDKARTPTLSMAVAQTPYSTGNIDSTWNQTSLIGKIFVAFGGLLTVASAARMFMA
jgi:hypothetical protein